MLRYKVYMANKWTILGNINVDGKVLNGGFNFLVTKIKGIVESIKSIYSTSAIYNFCDVIEA